MSLGLFEGFCPIAPQGALDSLGCFVASFEVPILIVVLVAVVGVGWFIARRRETDFDQGILILPMGGTGQAGASIQRVDRA